MTTQEINELVARKLGLEPLGDRWHRKYVDDKNCCDDLPDYCHSIAAASEIVEKTKMGLMHNGKGWYAISNSRVSFSESAPMAICETFLKDEVTK